MKSFYCLLLLFISACGTHNYAPVVLRNVNKTGSLINLTNNRDTLSLGDTIGMEFMLPNPVKLDDSSEIVIKNITKTGIGYNFIKSNKEILALFTAHGDIVEKSKNASNIDGRFYFNPILIPLLGTTIHFVPKDTGTYILSTMRFQYLYCDIEGSTDQVQINFNPEFNVPNIHSYLLDPYPTWQTAMANLKVSEATPYYCFYVKPK
jgi:hypothetical protein